MDLNKTIKSKTVRYLLVGLFIIFVGLVYAGLFTNKLDHIWGIGFNNSKNDTLKKIESQTINNGDIQIGTHNGDILKDSSIKIVYETK